MIPKAHVAESQKHVTKTLLNAEKNLRPGGEQTACKCLRSHTTWDPEFHLHSTRTFMT